MKILVLFVFLAASQFAFNQIDTLNPLSQKQIADSVYRSVDQYIGTGKLYNRLLFDDTNQSVCWNAHQIGNSITPDFSSADYMYGVLYELKHMSVDTSSVPGLTEVFDSIQRFVGEWEFEKDIYCYPLSIIDYDYNYIDVNSNVQLGNITLDNEVIYVASSSPIIQNKRVQLVGPMFDLHDSDEMALVFKPEYFYSNRKQINEIASLQVEMNNQLVLLEWNQVYHFVPDYDSIQKFKLKVTYTDGTFIEKECVINTPELKLKSSDRGNSFPECRKELDIEINENKLKSCWIPRCSVGQSLEFNLLKPYILLTGYRPPVIGQSYKKTWKIYNDEHNLLLNSLRENNFDIILVKFNIHVKPYSHGMQQSADLLEKFILYVNENKGGQEIGHENVIQANSMSADIARLTLLRMEQKHLNDNSYPHHHSRLYMAYDANFYGANIPLAYQHQIYSHFKYPVVAEITSTVSLKWFLSTFLFATMQQKTVKELLMYHAASIDNDIFKFPYQHITYTPTHHWRRQEFYDKLLEVDNGVHIFPMPLSPRNISISLGKIRGTNNITNEGTPDPTFPTAGQYWRNVNLGLWTFRIRAGKFMPGTENTELFWRKKIGLSWNSIYVNHRVHVNRMQEIDNASGSYLEGTGNIISVANWTYFTLLNIFDGKDYFSHKSVLTGLGINKNLWPANGSHTLDMHSLKLMFNQLNLDYNNISLQSNHYGYPNLGRPNDHFQITPFEAIYVDNKINPHIKLKEDDEDDLAMLNNFILNEVEPWYLGLQNTSLGSKARSNYQYHSYRRAKHSIVVGNLVTPTTDPGDYIVEANGKLTLKAGDEIVLKNGVHFKAGSTVHIKPEYDECNDQKSGQITDNGTDETGGEKEVTYLNNRTEKIATNYFTIYPNPASDKVRIEFYHEKWEEARIISMNGEMKGYFLATDTEELPVSNLPKGMYLIQIQGKNRVETHKFIKL